MSISQSLRRDYGRHRTNRRSAPRLRVLMPCSRLGLLRSAGRAWRRLWVLRPTRRARFSPTSERLLARRDWSSSPPGAKRPWEAPPAVRPITEPRSRRRHYRHAIAGTQPAIRVTMEARHADTHCSITSVAGAHRVRPPPRDRPSGRNGHHGHTRETQDTTLISHDTTVSWIPPSSTATRPLASMPRRRPVKPAGHRSHRTPPGKHKRAMHGGRSGLLRSPEPEEAVCLDVAAPAVASSAGHLAAPI